MRHSFGPMKTMMYKILGIVLRGLIKTFGRTVYRLNVRNLQNVPSTGGALLVANHTSYMDFVLVVSSMKRDVRFVMNSDVFKKPGLRWLLQGLKCIPISPRGGKNDLDAFNRAVTEQVNTGNVVVIFAEGTVTRTGQLLEFKKGVEHLSSMISAPIIPIHFHNVHGSPFTFLPGRSKIEKFSFRSIRRDILASVGKPIHGKISAFLLRQRMKELEVENFELMLRKTKSLNEIVRDQLSTLSEGSWKCNGTQLYFNDINRKLAELDVVLKPLLFNDHRVALLLPKDTTSFLLNLWLLLNNKISVNLNVELDNEERYFVLKKAKVKTLITTIDLEFAKYAPNADQIIYLEHLQEAIESGREMPIITKRIEQISKKVSSFFKPGSSQEDVATILFEKRKGQAELKCIALSHRHILSAIFGLKQIYYFKRGSSMMSNLPIHHAYGYVVEFVQPLIYGLHVDMISAEVKQDQFVDHLMLTKPELVIATPSQLELIASVSQMKNLPFLTHIFTADLHPDSHHISLLGERGIKVMVCAGMNETSSVFAVNLHNYRGKDIAGKVMEQENMLEGSIGKPLPGIALKVCDSSFNELEHSEEGIIWLKGSCISPAHSDGNDCRPDLVDGWFNTNLVGSLNHKGFAILKTKVKAS
jgi:acyl-[acyl-carrier-protein]-phospholipid O-acyltransferase/long-chain-fatty-acid--[acyl-carrier-protein] ligase